MSITYVDELQKEVHKKLMDSKAYANPHTAPRLEKIVVSVGIGSYMQKSKDFGPIAKNLELLTGQKPVVKLSKKAISNFKLREGMPVALMVTLRGKKMYGFLKKLISVVLPRVRDFRGLSVKSFDGSGNYSLGLKDQTVFPEVVQDDNMLLHGVQVTLSTTATNNDDGFALLSAMGMPYQK